MILGMSKDKKNIAFIDGQNLHLGSQNAGWVLDHQRFRIYLKDSLGVSEAYYYFGYIDEQHQGLYTNLQRSGFIVRFKVHNQPLHSGKKGNVDTEIIFDVMKMLLKGEIEGRVILVSGDGDYIKMVRFLIDESKFERMVFPSGAGTSSLYNKIDSRYKVSLDWLRNKVAYTK